MNPLGTPYKSYLAIPIVVVISVLVTDIFYHNPSHAVKSHQGLEGLVKTGNIINPCTL